MNEQQKIEILKPIAAMMALSATMSQSPEEVPGILVRATAEEFLFNLTLLAETIGGAELRNEALLSAAQAMAQMDAMMGVVSVN